MTIQPSQDFREVPGLSPDPRVRVFRRVLRGFADFEGMEVDAYVVLGKTHAVILDTMLCPADMARIMTAIEADLGNQQILCVNSHADWDHCWGNGYFNSVCYVPILAHEQCRQRLLSPEARLELENYRKNTEVFNEVTLVAPTLTFNERLTIAAGGLTIDLLHAPGHCRDQIVAWLSEIGLLLAFDAVEMPLPSVEDDSCVPLMFSTLQRLVTLNAPYVLCSHGSNSNSAALIQENLTYLREIERRARLLLEDHTPTTTELEQAATFINYPFDEVIAGITVDIDRSYYNWAHEHNTQSIVRWLMAE